MGEFYLIPLTFLLAGFLTEDLLSFAFLSNGFFVAVFFGTRGVFFSLLETFLPGDFFVFSACLRAVFSFAATFLIFGLLAGSAVLVFFTGSLAAFAFCTSSLTLKEPEASDPLMLIN